MSLTLSIVIVTYNREQVLVDTVKYLYEQIPDCQNFQELIIVDQTKKHEEVTERFLEKLNDEQKIRWIRLPDPDLTKAMNRGLLEANSDIVLYVDDDIIPHANFLHNHIKAYEHQEVPAAVVGQVLQPHQQAEDVTYSTSSSNPLMRFKEFPFNSKTRTLVENVIACNLSVKREKALEVGGFDENFRPTVAFRFETEFAKRLIANGYKILFEPTASINHLAAKSGGVRSEGSHLSSASPRYGVGDYYFALRHGTKLQAFFYSLRRLFREVRTRFHLRRPWYIPVKMTGEIRAVFAALSLFSTRPRLLTKDKADDNQ